MAPAPSLLPRLLLLLGGLGRLAPELRPCGALSVGAAAKASGDGGSGVPAEPGDDLREWIPRMRAKKAHGGSLEELSKEHRVVVVMTTIPPRIDSIEPVLDSMLRQTWPLAAVYLSVPHRYNRTGEAYTIPSWLENKPGVRIARCEDLGPGTHLLNGLRLEQDPWTFMAVVDDDHIYSPNLVETLMRSALAHPGSAVAAQGFLSVPGLKLEKDSPRYLHDQGFAAGPVLVSYLGVVYQRGFFDDSVFDYGAVSEKCRYQDDMWFSAHLARKGIPRMVLGAALGVQELKDMHLGPSSLTFWQENKPREVSSDCNGSLLRLFADIWTQRRRVVLALNGLPPLADPERSATVADGPGWDDALAALRALPYQPDLIYLCSEPSAGAGKDGGEVLGTSGWIDGLVVTGSNACQAYASEARIGQLLRDPLKWEGDSDTVIMLGTLRDVVRQGAELPELAACAAERFMSNSGEGGYSPPPHDPSPFCRRGELTAVSVGAFGAAAA